MRKSQVADILARRLGVRIGRINSLTQRAAEDDLLPTSCGAPYPELSPVEIARMVIIAAVDEGLGSAAATIKTYGGMHCAALKSNLESMLGHTLARAETIAPAHSGLTVYCGANPAAVLTRSTSDGVIEYVFAAPSSTAKPSGVERIVTISGASLASIAHEIGGASPDDVDRLMADVTTPPWQPETAAA